jgi:protein-tyrosine-phosphatase
VSSRSFWLVLPINDLAVEFLNRYKADLEKFCIVGGINDGDTIRYSQNKYELWKICKEIGINVAATTYISSLQEFEQVKNNLKLPLIAKPVSSRKIVGNRIYSFTVRRFSEVEPLEDFIRERISSIPIMLQELVNGFGIGFNFLAKDGQVIAFYMHERINEPAGGGESSYRKTIVEDKYGIIEKSIQLISHIKWNGVGMIEYKVSDGKAYIIELNGRFWGSIELGIFAGIEIPYWQVLYNYENKALPAEPISNKRVVYARNLRNDLLSSVKEKSIKGIFKWIGSIPSMFRFTERIEDSVFTDFRFRTAMWWNLGARFIQGRRQRMKTAAIPLNRTAALYSSYQRVLFICEGNICRSPFAEKYLVQKKRGIVAASCGLQFQAFKMSPLKAVKAAKEAGVDLSTHRSAFIADMKVEDFDAVFVMDKSNYQKLAQKYPQWINKVFFLDTDKVIVDPFGGTDTDFQKCYAQIRELINRHFA